MPVRLTVQRALNHLFLTRYPLLADYKHTEGDLRKLGAFWVTFRSVFGTEKEVAVGQHTLQVVLDSLETIVVDCDSHGRLVLSNRAARQLFGSLLDNTPIDQWPDLLHVTDSDGRQLHTDDLSLLRAKDA